MTRILWRLALLVLTVVVFTPPRAAHAQGLAAMAVATASASTGTVSLQPKLGCWGCDMWGQVYKCSGGHNPGYWNCSLSIEGCNLSSSGCGGSALIPVDLDGAAQYVSRAVMQLREAGGGEQTPPGVERNCDGVVVARQQSPDNIAGVRIRTAALSL